MKKFVIIIFSSLLIIKCAATIENATKGAYELIFSNLFKMYEDVPEVLVNSFFAYSFYKETGKWPTKCEDFMNLLPDTMSENISDSALCYNYLILFAEQDTLRINWTLLQRMEFGIINDSILKVNVVEFNNNMTKKATYEFPVTSFQIQ